MFEWFQIFMIDFDYLSKGLNALARAHLTNTMAGHLGASVMAGYFVGELRPGLEDEVYAGLENDLERVIGGHSVFGSVRWKQQRPDLTEKEMFADFPKEKANESLVDGIAEALEKSLGEPRQSGHNVIFGSIAIRALKEHPDLATPSVVEGIRKLMDQFRNVTPGNGNYGKGKGRIHGNKIALPEIDDSFPPYENLEAMANAVLDELIHQDPEVHRQGYGGLVHITNHAAAITDLAQYGYPELVPEALEAHHKHMRLWRTLPDLAGELGPPAKPSAHDVHSAAYWTSGEVPADRALLTHRSKTMFGFDELAQVVEDEDKTNRAYATLRYLM